MAFYGRKHELELLRHESEKSTPSFVTVLGRRRIGKSKLIDEFAEKFLKTKHYFRFEGAWVAKEKTKNSMERVNFQLAQFGEQFEKYFGLNPAPTSWTQAFTYLEKFLPNPQSKFILFLDEISWIADGDSDSFKSSLKIFWDQYSNKNLNIMLVIAGSVTAWIKENILEDSGFYGRVSQTIVLKELNLKECSKFLGQHLSPYEKIAILATIGGVPRYLEEIQHNKDSVWNIQNTFFKDGHILHKDYFEVFEHTFHRRSQTYLKIIEALRSRRGLSAAEIRKAIQYQSGMVNDYLTDLANAGFIRETSYWKINQKKFNQQTFYTLSDNYIRFYLSYVKPNIPRIKAGIYKLNSLESLDNWDTVAGLQFENLVVNCQEEIIELLQLDRSIIKMLGAYHQKPTKSRKGCQIDLLVETSKSLYICEMKYQRKIGLEVIKNTDEKVRAFRTGQSSLENYNIFKVLIYSGKLSMELKKEDYFSHLFDVADLL